MCRWHAVVRCRGGGVGGSSDPIDPIDPPPGYGPAHILGAEDKVDRNGIDNEIFFFRAYFSIDNPRCERKREKNMNGDGLFKIIETEKRSKSFANRPISAIMK